MTDADTAGRVQGQGTDLDSLLLDSIQCRGERGTTTGGVVLYRCGCSRHPQWWNFCDYHAGFHDAVLSASAQSEADE